MKKENKNLLSDTLDIIDEEVPFEIKLVESIEDDSLDDLGDSLDPNKNENKNNSLEEEEKIQLEEESKKPKEEDSANKIWAQWAHEKNLIDFKEEEFEDTEDFLVNKFNEKVTKTANESLHPLVKEINEKALKGVPITEWIESKSREAQYENITDTDIDKDENLQEEVVKEYLYNVLGYSDEEVKDELDTYKDSLKLPSKAKLALKKLKANEEKIQSDLEFQAEQKQIEDSKKAQKLMDDFKKEVFSKEEFIEGVKVKDKNKFWEKMTKRNRDGFTEWEVKMKDPEMRLKVAQFVLELDGKLDVIERKNLTKVTNNLKKGLEVEKTETPSTSLSANISVAKKVVAMMNKNKQF